jgi:F-type H+-transporting ATPase subunit epsilon
MFLKVSSPKEIIYQGEVSLVQMPGKMGSFEILHNHAPLVALLQEGRIKIIDFQRNTIHLDISSGLVHVKNNRIKIVTENKLLK